MVALCNLLLGLMVYQFYLSTLVSFLLNVPGSVINSVKEILDSGFSIGFENVLYATALLRVSLRTYMKVFLVFTLSVYNLN